jgi:broad specificity phosphatase PhoE
MPLSLGAGLTLYFCRHGETEGNFRKMYQGQSVDSPLTPKGIEQARAIGRILEGNVPDIRDYAFVCSPIGRARQTNEVIRETLSLPARGYAVDDRLKEINYGIWEGHPRNNVRVLDPAGYDAREKDKWNVPAPGGESYAQVAKRAESWIQSLSVDTFSVTHGAFARVLRGLFMDLDWREMSALDEPQGVVFRVRGNSVEKLEAA